MKNKIEDLKKYIISDKSISEIKNAFEQLEKWNYLFDCRDKIELNNQLYDANNIEILKLFSHLRTNLIEWIPFKKSENVILIGSDKGIYSSFLCDKVDSLVIYDEDYFECLLTVKRCEYRNHLKCINKKYNEIKNVLKDAFFDYCIVVDPYIEKTGCDKNRNLVKNIISILKPDGIIIWGANNQMGLKYWAGCMDSAGGEYFAGIEQYNGRNLPGNPSYMDFTLFLDQLKDWNIKMYYPYPDLFFPMSIYSDDYLPKRNELTKNAFSWEERLLSFNEVSVWNNIIRNNLFRQFSNSFLAIISKDKKKLDELNLFTKYSNDRDDKFSIRTDVYEDVEGKKHIRKLSCSDLSYNHIENMKIWYKRLRNLYNDTIFKLNLIENSQRGEIIFEYIDGEPFIQNLERYLLEDNFDEFIKIFKQFTTPLLEKSIYDFEVTKEFVEVFGYIDMPAGLRAANINDIDLILSNILVEDSNLSIIDYEWVFEFKIPVNFMIYRSVEYLFKGPRETLNYNGYYMAKIYEDYKIDDRQISAYKKMENNFQEYVCGNHIPLRKMIKCITNNYVQMNPRVYFDFGKGFRASLSYVCEGIHFADGRFRTRIGLPYNLKNLRFDPSDKKCLIYFKEIKIYGDVKEDICFVTNGKELGENIYFFDTTDSQIIFNNISPNKTYIEIDMVIIEFNDGVIEKIKPELFTRL